MMNLHSTNVRMFPIKYQLYLIYVQYSLLLLSTIFGESLVLTYNYIPELENVSNFILSCNLTKNCSPFANRAVFMKSLEYLMMNIYFLKHCMILIRGWIISRHFLQIFFIRSPKLKRQDKIFFFQIQNLLLQQFLKYPLLIFKMCLRNNSTKNVSQALILFFIACIFLCCKFEQLLEQLMLEYSDIFDIEPKLNIERYPDQCKNISY